MWAPPAYDQVKQRVETDGSGKEVQGPTFDDLMKTAKVE